MTKRILIGATSVVATILFSGCSTIINGKTQALTITSEPIAAKVSINGNQICETPCTQQINRGKDTLVMIEKEGYKSQTINPSTNMEGWFWGNIILGGVVGSTTDISTGSAYQYNPNTYHVNLPKE